MPQRTSQFEVEDEVLSLHAPFSRAISIAAFFGLTLAPADTPSGAAARARDPAPQPAATASPLSANEANVSASTKAKEAEPSVPTGVQGPCASGMLLVDGDYCPDADQICLKWLDPPPYENLRCAEYAKPAKCKVPRKHRRFCIDREEFAESEPGASASPDALPIVNRSWGEAKTLCEARGARLCKETEWEFACEGTDMNPYPYGFSREAGMCNVDRTDLGGPGDKLRDHRAALSAFPQCTSAFGVHDMTGNVDEWVEREGIAAPHRSSLRGGWWLPGRNRCRAATTHHDESYGGKQVGFRCCADP